MNSNRTFPFDKKAKPNGLATTRVRGVTRGDPRQRIGLRRSVGICCTTNRRLDIVGSRSRIDDAITPNIRAKFGEGEARVFFHELLAQVGTGFSNTARAQIKVANGYLQPLRENLALGWLRNLEVGFEVHSGTIDHFDLPEQSFLHVDQNDSRGYL